MDCKSSIRILLSCLLAFIAGCVDGTLAPFRSNEPSMPMIDTSAKMNPMGKELSKRAPKPMTCVAFGRLQLDAARDGNRSPAQCRELYDTARKYYQEAIRMDANCVDAYYGLAQAYEGLGDHARIAETYQKAQKTFPKNPAFYYEMGMYQARRKEWGAALDSLTKATELNPENRLYANMRGHCLARMGRYDEALTWFTKTLGEAEAHYNVARMLHHNKQEDACKQHLQRALELDPRLSDARDFLAQIEAPAQAVQPAVHSALPAEKGAQSNFATQK